MNTSDHFDVIVLGLGAMGEERVLTWEARDGRVEVRTDRATYSGDHLVVTAGPWAGTALLELGLPLAVERNVMYWFRPPDPAPFSPDRFPIYIYEYQRDAFIYGFPQLRRDGVKVAHDHSGERCTPETIRREVAPGFIIDRHPHHPEVTIACGFSGHGFKFASVVGEVLADLAGYGHTRHPIALFRLGRFATPA